MVVGFLFDPTQAVVVLVEKQRPDWQRGRYNGVGGHVEAGETPEEAMSREFEEEAGIAGIDWTKFAVLHGEAWVVHFFTALDGRAIAPQTKTDEKVEAFLVDNIATSKKLISNVKWLVPLALDVLREDRGPSMAAVVYAKL
jgi:8-oxo-dGTP diphosphatase